MKLYMNGLGEDHNVFVAEVQTKEFATMRIDALESRYIWWMNLGKPADKKSTFEDLMERFDGVDFTLESPEDHASYVWDNDEEEWLELPRGDEKYCPCGGVTAH